MTSNRHTGYQGSLASMERRVERRLIVRKIIKNNCEIRRLLTKYKVKYSEMKDQILNIYIRKNNSLKTNYALKIRRCKMKNDVHFVIGRE